MFQKAREIIHHFTNLPQPQIKPETLETRIAPIREVQNKLAQYETRKNTEIAHLKDEIEEIEEEIRYAEKEVAAAETTIKNLKHLL